MVSLKFCQYFSIFVCVMHLDFSLSLDIFVGDTVFTNKTLVVPELSKGTVIQCDGANVTWIFQNGQPVQILDQMPTLNFPPVFQFGNSSIRLLNISVSFTANQQGFYTCSSPSSKSAYIGVFLKRRLVPSNIRISPQIYPIAIVSWDPPEVGSTPLTNYKVVTVHPPNRQVKTTTKSSHSVFYEASPDEPGEYLFKLRVVAVYGEYTREVEVTKEIFPPPSEFTAQPLIQKGSVSLRWRQIFGQVRGYVIELRRVSNGEVAPYGIFPHLVRGDIVIIKNLAAGEKYQFRVRVEHGTDTISFPTQPVTVVTYSEPDAPVLTDIKAVSTTELVVSWQPPANEGGLQILKFYLRLNEKTFPLNPNIRNYHLSNLDPDENYIISISAENSIGRGRESAERMVNLQELSKDNQQNSFPLEIVIPSIAGGVVVIVFIGITLVFYMALRKRKRRQERQVPFQYDPPRPPSLPNPQESGRSHTWSASNTNVIDHRPVPPLPPETVYSASMPRRPMNALQTDTIGSYVAQSQINGFENPSASTNIVSGHSTLYHSSQPTQGVYSGQQSDTFSSIKSHRNSHDYESILDAVQFPIRKVLSNISILEERSESSSSEDEEYEDLNPDTILDPDPGYQKLKAPGLYESIRPDSLVGDSSSKSPSPHSSQMNLDLESKQKTGKKSKKSPPRSSVKSNGRNKKITLVSRSQSESKKDVITCSKTNEAQKHDNRVAGSNINVGPVSNENQVKPPRGTPRRIKTFSQSSDHSAAYSYEKPVPVTRTRPPVAPKTRPPQPLPRKDKTEVTT